MKGIATAELRDGTICEEAETHGMIRVVDEDLPERDEYLYPVSMVVPVELPGKAKQALTVPGEGTAPRREEEV